MAALQISLFGGFDARMGPGDPLRLKGRKTQAVLAYLALSLGKQCSRDELVALLWSTRGEQQARSSLRQALTELRRALGDGNDSLLIAERDSVALDAEAVSVDVGDFERLIEAGGPVAFEEAATLYQGDLLDGVSVQDPAFENWLRDSRQRLQERACIALSGLLEQQESGDAERAMATARRLLALDPLRESTHRALMRLYAGKGERTLALRQHRACREVLAAELGVAPEPETENLAEEIRSGDGTGDGDAPPRDTEAPEAGPLPLPNKPAIAVLPFANLSGDPEQVFFSDGITEDIITALSKFQELFVIARHSSFHYRDRAASIDRIRRELGVHYVVEGSVRKAGSRVRVTAQLVEAANEQQLWAERYDRELQDIFAVQDELARVIVATLTERMKHAAAEHAKRKPAADMASYEHVLQGRQLFYAWNSRDNRKARDRFEAAVGIDPDYATGQVYLALTYYAEWIGGWSAAPHETLARFCDLAEKALALDAADHMTQDTVSLSCLLRRRFDEARYHGAKALNLNPNDADIVMGNGYIALFDGRQDEAINLIKQAQRLNPFGRFGLALGMALFSAKRYQEAIAALKTVRARVPHGLAYLAAAYAHIGADAEARAAAAGLLEVARAEMSAAGAPPPANWLTFLAERFPYRERADLGHLLDGLRQAGLAK